MQFMMVIGIYLGLGIIVLMIFDFMTKRIRKRLGRATDETQSKLASSGNYVGHRTSFIILIGALWLMWPAVIYGAFTGGRNGEKG